MRSPPRSNCLVWAFWRFWTRGGYVVMRRSETSPLVPHFLWSRHLKHFWSYSPIRRHRVPWNALWFRGRVRRGK